MSEILAMTSRTPIAFYGKVIDQRGSPIAGAKVTAGVQAADPLYGKPSGTVFDGYK